MPATITMDDDNSPYERVLTHKREFIHQSLQTNNEANTLEAISGHKSNKDLAPWMDKVLLEHSELVHKCTNLSSEMYTFEEELETLQIPPDPVQREGDEAELFDLITEAFSNTALLQRLVDRMPLIPLPLSLQKHQEQTVELLEKVKHLSDQFKELKAEHQENHARSKRFQGIVPAYTRLKRSHDAWQQEKNTAQAIATAAQEATQAAEKKLQQVEKKLQQVEKKLQQVEKKLQQVEKKLQQVDSRAKDADAKKGIAIARAEAAEKEQQKALARAKGAEREQQTTLARAEAAEKEQQKALARAEAAEKEQQKALSRAKGAEREQQTTLARAKAAEQEQKTSLARAEAAEREQQKALARAKGAEREQQTTLARAEAAEKEQQKALGRAEAAEKEQQKALARAEAAEKEQQKALARAEAAEKEQQKALARAKGAEKEQQKALARAKGAEKEQQKALARAEAAEREQQKALARAKGAEREQQTTLARAEAAEKEQQKALARAEAAEKEQQKALARAEAAEKEQQKALARAKGAEKEQQKALARAEAAEHEQQKSLLQDDTFKQSSENLQRQVTELTSTREILSRENRDLRRVRLTLEKEQKRLSTTTDQQKIDLSGFVEQMQNLRLEVTELKSSNCNLQTKLSANQTRLVCAKQDNETLRAQSEEDHDSVVTLRASLRRSESELAAERLAQVTSLHLVARLEHDISRQKCRYTRLKTKIANLQADKAAIELANGNLADRVDELSARNDWKTNMIQGAHSCVIRLRSKIKNLLVDLARHKEAVDVYQRTTDVAAFQAAQDLATIESWQTLFHSLVGEVPPDWTAFQKVIAISKDMIDLPYCLSGDEWFESTSCLADPRTTVDILHMFRCFLKNSLTFKEVRAIAESMVECHPSTRRIILSAMFAHLQKDLDELSVADAVAMLTMQDLLHRYLMGTALGRRVATNLAITEAMQKSPLVAGLAKWSCTGISLADAISAEAVRLGLSLMKDGVELIADENRLLKITKDRELSIFWPGEFEVVYGRKLQIKIGDKVHFSWDLIDPGNNLIDILNNFSGGAIGPVVKGF